MDEFFKMLKEKLNINLTNIQKEAVMQTKGTSLILSCAGSGKTTVNVILCANLILNHGMKPERILLVTFSKASAIDMEHRFNKFFGDMIKGRIKFSTIHSLALAIVYDNSRLNGVPYRIIESEGVEDEEKQEAGSLNSENRGTQVLSKISLLKKIYISINDDYPSEDRIEELLTDISYVMNTLMDDHDMTEYKSKVPNFAEVFSRYREIKKQKGLLDFDDMIVKAYEILKTDKRILEIYRNKYDFILVDEAQDTSLAQHELIYLLAQPKCNLCIVGDDDQSIYGWRGADSGHMLNIHKRYPGIKILYMEQNFRSTKKIINMAGELIKNNKLRYPKGIYTENEVGSDVDMIKLKNEDAQLKYIMDKIKSGSKYSDHAVLFRNNISAILLSDKLDRAGIPFYFKDQKLSFFKNWLVQDILNCIRFAHDFTDVDTFIKIYYKLNCYITKEMVIYLRKEAAGLSVFKVLGRYPDLKPYQIQKLVEAEKNFTCLDKEVSSKRAINIIECQLGYWDYVVRNMEKANMSIDSPKTVLNILYKISEDAKTKIELLSRLEELRDSIVKSKMNRFKNAVVLTTVHSAKGLEYENVYMIDLYEGEFPCAESISEMTKGNNKLIEEERRLFYVGITRAKKQLTLMSIEQKNAKNVDCSRFLHEAKRAVLPQISDSLVKTPPSKMHLHPVPEFEGALMDYASADRGEIIRHKKFGRGVILSIDYPKDKIQIKFDGCGIKQLSIEFCKVSKLLFAG